MEKRDLEISLLILPYLPFLFLFALRPSFISTFSLYILFIGIVFSHFIFVFLWDAINGNPEIEQKLQKGNEDTSFVLGLNYRTHFLASSLVLLFIFILLGSSLYRSNPKLLFFSILCGLFLGLYRLFIRRILRGRRKTNPEVYKLKLWSGNNFLQQVKKLVILSLVVISSLILLVSLVVFVK